MDRKEEEDNWSTEAALKKQNAHSRILEGSGNRKTRLRRRLLLLPFIHPILISYIMHIYRYIYSSESTWEREKGNGGGSPLCVHMLEISHQLL